MKPETRIETKRKFLFACLMGVITTGIISFSLIAIHVGFKASFWDAWLRSWALAYVLVVPAILFIAPPVERLVSRIIHS